MQVQISEVEIEKMQSASGQRVNCNTQRNQAKSIFHVCEFKKNDTELLPFDAVLRGK